MAAPYEGDSTLASIAGLTGTNTAGGIGVKGTSETYQGISGVSTSNAGVAGESTQFVGVYGTSHDPHNAGVMGVNDNNGWGVTGRSANVGVSGESTQFVGVYGTSHDPHNAGVMGVNDNNGWGVTGRSANVGVSGECLSTTGVGVHGKGGILAGFFEGGVKVVGELYSESPTSAARFVGPIQLNGPTTINGNLALNGTMTVQSGHDLIFADFAEHFEPAPGQTLEPGAVVVLTDTGHIKPCQTEYDTRVVGVISGAGNFRPAMILDRRPGDSADKPPVALMGKVYCMADATGSPIRAGDLLTSSSRPGHAMTAGDHAKRTGAIIGKALQPLITGVGLIPILVTLQ